MNSIAKWAKAAYASKAIRGFALALLLVLLSAQAIGPTTGLQSVVVYSDTLYPLQTLTTAASVVTAQTDPLSPLDVSPAAGTTWDVALGASVETTPAVGSTWPVSVADPVTVTAQGTVSTVNSTATPLGGGATWTGTAEDVSAYSQTTVFVSSDVDGIMYLDVGTDGTNWDTSVTIPYTGTSAGSPHTLVVTARYFRARYVNGVSAQGHLRLQTIYHAFKGKDLTSRINQSVTLGQDVNLVRNVSDFPWEAARGTIAGRSVVHKFGRNPLVGATEEAIWTVGGAYNFLTAADTIRIKAGGNAADTAAGLGAQEVTCETLAGSTWADQTVVLTTAGASASASSAESVIRCYRCWVSASGTYGANNTGAVVIETTGGTTLAQIVATAGQTQLGVYTVPAGKTAYLLRMDINVEGAKGADVRVWQRQNADDVTGPSYSARRLVYEVNNIAGFSTHAWLAMQRYPEKTDLWLASTRAGASDVAVSANLDLWISED